MGFVHRSAVVAGLATLALIARPTAVEAAGCPVPGFDTAAFGYDGVHLKKAILNSYDSSTGAVCSTTPAPGNCVAGIGTNSTAAGSASPITGLDLENSASIKGNCTIGPGGSTTNITGASYCQSTSVAGSPKAQTPVTVPSGATALGAIGNMTIASAGNYTATSITLNGGDELKITSGPVVIFLSGNLAVSGTGEVNNVGKKPSDLIIMCTGGPTDAAQDIDIGGNGIAYWGVYCPFANIRWHGSGSSGEMYGALVGKTVEIYGSSPAFHYDTQLASYTNSALCPSSSEVSRASPVVALLNGGLPHVVQGTFEPATGLATSITSAATITTWSFPYLKGHMRARLASSISTTSTGFSAGTIYFDAGATGKIPAANYTGCTSFNGSCRHIFTNTNSDATDGTTFHPTTSILNDTTAAAIGALIVPSLTTLTTANHQSIIHKILDAKLGGVDRSTVAVIEPSAFAGVSTRPTMAYFGAADGMLHAVCAQAGGRTASYPSSDVCPSAGTELWAFIPRVQLPLIAANAARIDGSVRVSDVFGDFTNNPATGTKSWHTILTFQTGYALGSKGAVYAFDITDPANPTLLWEYTKPSSPGATELGTGLMIAQAAPYVKGALTNMVVAQTNNGGTGTAGVVAVALSQETGSRLWKFGEVYPLVPRGVALDGPLPTTAIPGGAVGVDSGGDNYVSDFVMGDIYGRIWQIGVVDGVSKNGAGVPLFSSKFNKHPFGAPPAIYKRNGQHYAAFASGGYADPISTTWSTTGQYIIAAKLAYTGGTVDEDTTASSTGALGINFALTNTTDKGFSQALVVGTQLFVTADSSDINATTYGSSTSQTGHLTSVDLTGAGTSGTTALITSGATSLAYNSATNNLYGSSRNQQERLSATPSNATGGEKVDLESAPQVTRNLWLRSE